MSSPFRFFRSGSRTNKIMMAGLTALAMFAFIIADALPNGQGGGGSLLTYLPFALAMAAGALIFWVFGSSQGKGSTFAAVGAGVGLLFAFFLPTLLGKQYAVSSSVGTLDEIELQERIANRRIANQFMMIMAEEVYGRPGEQIPAQQWEQMVRSLGFGPINGLTPIEERREVGRQFVMAQEADEVGIRISDSAVAEYLSRNFGKKIREDFIAARKQLKISDEDLFDILRYQIKAKLYASLIQPEPQITPAQLWDYYKRMAVMQTMTVAEVPVSAFTKSVDAPTDERLMTLYEQYKNQFRRGYFDDDLGWVEPVELMTPEPKFGRLRSVKLAYLEAKYDEFVGKADPVTDEQIEEYYQENRANYRNPRSASKQAESATPFNGPAVAERGAGKGSPGGPAMAEVPPFLPLSEVRDQIDATLTDINERKAAIAARREMDAAMEAADDFMEDLQEEYTRAIDAGKEPDHDGIATKLRDFAKKNQLTYQETPLLQPWQLQSQYENLSLAIEPKVEEVDSFVEGIDKELRITRREGPVVIARIFRDPPTTLYMPHQGVDSTKRTQSFPGLPGPLVSREWNETGNRYVYWKVEDSEGRIPEFTEIREQVVQAFKTIEAREPAEKRAETLAKQVREAKDEAMQDVLAEVKLGGEPIKVTATGSFAWMEPAPFNMRNPQGSPPQISQLDAVPKAGPAFMETVFQDLEAGEVGVARNADATAFYVAKIDSRDYTRPTEREALQQAFINFRADEPQERVRLQGMQQVASSEAGDLLATWLRGFDEQYGLEVLVPVEEEVE
ncbi:ZIP family metal transporter [Thalassoroseus pseudoceratinae]|uniref:hypothetical protein n=1 Tax=Thalassoroseus pseudoceratinae TaxID=2713176 RepID=UPI001420426D|nr:hypothetical protein [Thalassoroseus pseudoceratinae]